MMDARTLQALKASIEHWREVGKMTADEGYKNIGRKYCALCMIFNTDEHDYETACIGCPLEPGHRCGSGSHYEKAEDAACRGDDLRWRSAARAMRRKLESLLPKENAP